MATFYMTPEYHMWDLSKAVLFAFAVFFSMIFANAGYGVLLGIILQGVSKRLGRTTSGRGVVLALVIFSIIHGELVGTQFGVPPPVGSWLASLHMLHAEDRRLMIWIAIDIGALHLAHANLATIWRRGHSPTALCALGCAAIILGGFCVGLGKSYSGLAPLISVGWDGLALGGLLVLLFTSVRPLNLGPKPLLGRFIDGREKALELPKAFGDVPSYLRLFALGLASVKLAEAFNELAVASFAAKGALVLLGLLVLLARLCPFTPHSTAHR